MPALTLSPAERKAHKAAAHHLQAVVMVGAQGLTPAVRKEVDLALSAHGLIKLRVLSDDRATRSALMSELCEALACAPVQAIGKLLVLWRPMPERERIPDPERGTGPRRVTLVKPSRSATHRPVVKKIRLLGNQRITQGGHVKRAKVRASAGGKKKAGG